MSKIVYIKTTLTGGGASALDGINGTVLADGDMAFVNTGGGTGGLEYIYILDDDSAATEDSPRVISPDSNPGNKRWILQSIVAPKLFINDTANTKNTYGFTVNQLAADNEIISLKSSDVAHSFTTNTEADTYGLLRKVTGANGGLFIQGFNDTDDTAMLIGGYIGVTDPADTTPAVVLSGGKLSGTAAAALGAAETVLQVKNYATPLMTILGDGKVGIGVTNPTAKVHSYLNSSDTSTWTAYVENASNTGHSFGLLIDAGTNSSDTALYIRNKGGSIGLFSINGAGNVGIGQTSFGTSAAKVLAIGSGTAPTTSPADAAQLYVADHNGQAGYARLHQRPENVTYTPASPVALLSELEMYKNPLAYAQGVNYSTAGSSNGSGTMQAIGTGNFTISVRRAFPANGVNRYIFTSYSGANDLLYFRFRASGVLDIYFETTAGGIIYNQAGSIAYTPVAGSAHTYTMAVTRESVSTQGSAAIYVDGKLFETLNIAAGTPVSVPFTTTYTSYYTAATEYNTIVYNRALSAEEIGRLDVVGIAEADKWGSQTNPVTNGELTVDTTTWSGANGTRSRVDSESDPATSSVTAGATDKWVLKSSCTSDGVTHAVVYSQPAIGVVGQRYELEFLYYVPTGSPNLRVSLYMSGGYSETFNTLEGSLGTKDAWTKWKGYVNLTRAATNIQIFQSGADTGELIYLDALKIKLCGATLALEGEGIQPNPGQWLDSSSNKLHAWQPATGSSLTRYKNTFEIRGINTWAGTHEAQSITMLTDASRAMLPTDCYITEIIGVIAGATIEDIIIGDGSDTDHWVAATTGLAAGTTAFTIANHISDGTNMEMVVDPDANFTGTITWTIRGHILD